MERPGQQHVRLPQGDLPHEEAEPQPQDPHVDRRMVVLSCKLPYSGLIADRQNFANIGKSGWRQTFVNSAVKMVEDLGLDG